VNKCRTTACSGRRCAPPLMPSVRRNYRRGSHACVSGCLLSFRCEGPRSDPDARTRRVGPGNHGREPPAIQAFIQVRACHGQRRPGRRHAKGHPGVSEAAGTSEGNQAIKTVRYLVRINKDPDSDWGASVPDLPGCVATGKTIDVALRRIHGAIELHLRGMHADGIHPPRPRQRAVVPVRTKRQVDFYASVEVAA